MFRKLRSLCFASVLVVISWTQTALAQTPHRFALDRFVNESCRGTGRLQECDQNPVTKQILLAGSLAIPVLISQLDETIRTKKPIEDFWSYTTSGDVAFIILTDLFTDKDGKSFTMPGVPNWDQIMAGCNGNAEACWRDYAYKKGVRSLQQSWRTAWEANRDRVVWDDGAQCFRLKK
jgi:hypothetical protein